MTIIGSFRVCVLRSSNYYSYSDIMTTHQSSMF